MTANRRKGKQRGHGEGAVYFSEALGRWVGMLNLGYDPTGKRRRKKFTAKTRADLLSQMRTARRELDDGRKLARARDTVGDLLRDYLASGLPPSAKSPNTREGYRWAIQQHLAPGLGARKLQEFSPEDVDAFLQKKASEGLSRASLSRLHQVLQRALRWGERRGRVSRNVAQLVDVPEGKRRESKALTTEEARALLTVALQHRLGALFAIALTVPSRPGELTGLCWDCVDFDNGVIHFRRALHRNQAERTLELGELKTQQSRRSVEAPGLVIDALERRRTAQERERHAAGAAWANDHDLVFTSEIGTPIDPANLRRTLRKLAQQAGIPGRWTVYELRHSAISALSYAGVLLEEIADAAGHRNSRVTAVVYRHNLRTTVTSAKAPMEALFTPAEDTG